MASSAAPFGRLLRQARSAQGTSQMALALSAGVSTRHLSWLETGKAQPSRAMVIRLAERLQVPLRERNAWLQAAGFAPLYGQHRWQDPAMASVRESLQRLLDAHEPWPALAVDRHWHMLAHNRAVSALLQLVAHELLEGPINVLRVSLHPQGLAPLIVNLAEWRQYVLSRLQRQVLATSDPALAQLHDELKAMPGDADGLTTPALLADDLAVPIRLRTPAGTLSFITMLSVFGAPRDVTLSEIAVEALLPADAATGAALQALMGSCS